MAKGDGGEALVDRIARYYEERELVWPDTWQAMAFAQTEIGEAYELLLSRERWVRNNPEEKPEWDGREFAIELGDAIQMLIVAGYLQGRDVIKELRDKMDRKTPTYDKW